jgi:transmembrane sensor
MEPSLIHFVSSVARTERDALSGLDFERQRERFLVHARRRTLARGARPWLAVAAIAAALAVAVYSLRPPAALSFAAFGVQGGKGDWLAAPATESLVVDFSDGSSLSLQQESRVRVLDLADAGARMLLERGALEAKVTHRERSNWSFDAGPFRILVTGTAFRLAWDPTLERFELEMWEGSVKLSGPELTADCAVARGGRVVVNLHGDAASSGACTASESRAQPTAAIESGAPLPRSSSEVGAAVLDPPSAKQRATLGELSRLADQARFSGKPERAVEALLELRSRFSSSPEAGRAAFLLGRIAADQQGLPKQGARWFATYLEENRTGPFAPEALGRLLDCQVRAGQLQAARRTATRYLELYPGGAYEAIARHVRDAPRTTGDEERR